MPAIPAIKLERTDTTLDLSQKAEKVCIQWKQKQKHTKKGKYKQLYGCNHK